MEGIYTATYLFTTMGGFVHGHRYLIEISKEGSVYVIDGIKDLTTHLSINATLPFSSEISIRQHWQFPEESL